jgi:hypothetical protein
MKRMTTNIVSHLVIDKGLIDLFVAFLLLYRQLSIGIFLL